MIQSRLFREVVLPFATFASVIAIGLLGLGGAEHRRTLEEASFQRLAAIDLSLAARDDLFHSPVGSWRDDLQRFAAASGVRLTVVSGDGTPLADSAGDAALAENLASRPEFREASRTGIGKLKMPEAERMSVVVAVRASGNRRDRPQPQGKNQGQILGFVRAEASTADLDAAVAEWRLYAAGLVALATLVGLIWSVRIASRLAGPVEALTVAASAYTGQEQPLPVLVTGRSLAPLSAALTEMTRNLARRLDELRRENSQLRTSGERLSSVLSGMAEGVLAIGRDERVLFANPAAAGLLDIPADSLIGRPLWEAVRLPAIQKTALAALNGSEIPHNEIELPRSQITLALRAGFLPGDPYPGVVLVMHDITELKRLENVRREFVNNVSHELKTPLASIQAYTETLLEGAIDDPEHNTRFLNRIAEQADRLHNLILDVLRLARIEAGTDVFEIKKLTVGKIIQSCVDEHLAVATTRKLSLATEPPETTVRLNADPEGLRTVIDNLLDNAINYTPSGGRITIRWRRTDGMALIEVSDTGIGIPPEHQSRIFERFHRVDQARSRDHGGTGLGLAIVKHLVQVFSGRIEVESEVGKGSTFRVWLPAA